VVNYTTAATSNYFIGYNSIKVINNFVFNHIKVVTMVIFINTTTVMATNITITIKAVFVIIIYHNFTVMIEVIFIDNFITKLTLIVINVFYFVKLNF